MRTGRANDERRGWVAVVVGEKRWERVVIATFLEEDETNFRSKLWRL